MSNLRIHAELEFKAMKWDESDGINVEMKRCIMELLETFSKQGHSGMSAGYCLSLFEKLARFEPLTPLTGEDWEWCQVSNDGLFQNVRCSRVFKDSENGPHDIEAIIWKDKDGLCYTNFNSRKSIEFPYTPTREYREVDG